MKLNVIIGDQKVDVTVPDIIFAEAEAVFQKMDSDMDKGWQMSRDWVDNPNTEDRCKIVADRLVSAIQNDKENVATMMAGYLLSRMPGLTAVAPDINGEIQETEFIMGGQPTN